VTIAGLECVFFDPFGRDGGPTPVMPSWFFAGVVAAVVFDPGGAPLVGARVEIVTEGRVVLTSYTDGQGRFRFEALPPGSYDVRVLAPGLAPLVRREVPVVPGAPVALALSMPVPMLPMARMLVRQKAPVIPTTTANVKEVYEWDFVSYPGMFRSRDEIHPLLVVPLPRRQQWETGDP